jgi:hypothetical protein
MLRRGPDTDARHRRRDTPSGGEVDPFRPDASVAAPPPRPGGLGGWSAAASYLDLDPALVSEMARAAMGSPGVAGLQEGEIAVGAMLAGLAVRGEDVLLEELLAVSSAELRLNRYDTGHMTPIEVHPVATVAELLRALAWCASSGTDETWEVVAHDGVNPPVAIASARRHELRWLQPPSPDAPHNVTWTAPTTSELPPGSTSAWWQQELKRPLLPPTPAAISERAPAALAPIKPLGVAGREPTVAPHELLDAIRDTVDRSLASAFIELELEPGTLAELRDTSVLERLIESIVRLEQRLQQVEATNRQVQELSTVVEDLTEAARSLMRHQWDNMPPQNFWVRIQRSDDELRRSIDDLTSEVRSRGPRTGREPRAPRAARGTSDTTDAT